MSRSKSDCTHASRRPRRPRPRPRRARSGSRAPRAAARSLRWASTRARHACGEHLVRRQREGRGARLAEEAHDPGQVRHGEEQDVEAPRQARELERRLGHDAERPLAADEELAQVEAGVVLLERAVESSTSPLREHDLQPEHPVAGEALADDLHAARVRRDVAADGARPLRGEVDGPGEAVRRAVLVHRLRDGARLDAHGAARARRPGASPACARATGRAPRSRRRPRPRGPCARRRARRRRRASTQSRSEARDLVGRPREGHGARRGLEDARPVAAVLREVVLGARTGSPRGRRGLRRRRRRLHLPGRRIATYSPAARDPWYPAPRAGPLDSRVVPGPGGMLAARRASSSSGGDGGSVPVAMAVPSGSDVVALLREGSRVADGRDALPREARGAGVGDTRARGSPTAASKLLGYLRAGGVVPAAGETARAATGCRNEWRAVSPVGFVCVEPGNATLDPTRRWSHALAAPARHDARLPYMYGIVRRPGPSTRACRRAPRPRPTSRAWTGRMRAWLSDGSDDGAAFRPDYWLRGKTDPPPVRRGALGDRQTTREVPDWLAGGKFPPGPVDAAPRRGPRRRR